VNESFHQFSPDGISGLLSLAESHLSVHTWPECGYAAVDIYTCGQRAIPQNAITVLAEALGAQNVQQVTMKRGVPQGENTFVCKVLPQRLCEEHVLVKAKTVRTRKRDRLAVSCR